MAQCHKICLFLEHRVTCAMIYVKFNNHKRIISYSLWKGHGEMKISPWKKKTSAAIFGVERRTLFKIPTIKENTKTHVWSKNHGSGSCVLKLFKVFQLYTCLKCTQSTLHIGGVIVIEQKLKYQMYGEWSEKWASDSKDSMFWNLSDTARQERNNILAPYPQVTEPYDTFYFWIKESHFKCTANILFNMGNRKNSISMEAVKLFQF